jgi:ring-1,2-phenylacetyl-CoA epoxidase subunit PaaE
MNPQFHPLKIAQVEALTDDALAVRFTVPPELHDAYRFAHGQFITLKAQVDGEELRRSYSICMSERDYTSAAQIRVGIKAIPGGRFSNWARAHLRAGDTLDVMTPDGRFTSRAAPTTGPAKQQHIVAFAGGSGITPMIAIIKTVLETREGVRVTLIYGNRETRAIMFADELAALKNRYLAQLSIHHVLSDEPQEIELAEGVLDKTKCNDFLRALVPAASIDEAFICGPAPMMDAAEAALKEAGVVADKIRLERFGTPLPHASAAHSVASKPLMGGHLQGGTEKHSKVTVRLNGQTRTLKVPFQGLAILDAGLKAGLDLPYACKGGVCCTCRARVLQGEVKMDKNYTLETKEIAAGFVLTCQAHPITDEVVVSFDER